MEHDTFGGYQTENFYPIIRSKSFLISKHKKVENTVDIRNTRSNVSSEGPSSERNVKLIKNRVNVKYKSKY